MHAVASPLRYLQQNRPENGASNFPCSVRGRSGRLAVPVNRRRIARIGLLERDSLIVVVLIAVGRECRATKVLVPID